MPENDLVAVVLRFHTTILDQEPGRVSFAGQLWLAQEGGAVIKLDLLNPHSGWAFATVTVEWPGNRAWKRKRGEYHYLPGGDL